MADISLSGTYMLKSHLSMRGHMCNVIALLLIK